MKCFYRRCEPPGRGEEVSGAADAAVETSWHRGRPRLHRAWNRRQRKERAPRLSTQEKREGKGEGHFWLRLPLEGTGSLVPLSCWHGRRQSRFRAPDEAPQQRNGSAAVGSGKCARQDADRICHAVPVP